MTPKLIEPGQGDEPTREIPLTREENLLGRGSDCDVRLRDQDVSRHHCLIRVRGSEVTISDLGSSNGTIVNGHSILSQFTLNSGDEIVVGNSRFLFDSGAGLSVPDVDPLAKTRRITAKEVQEIRDKKK